MERAAGHLFSALYILETISDFKELQKWLKKYNKVENVDDLLKGYKLFFEINIWYLIDSIKSSENPLNLAADRVLRSAYHNTHLEDIPNTCEQTILIKRIYSLERKVRKARDVTELLESLNEFKSLYLLFNEIYKENAISIGEIYHNHEIDGSIGKRKALKFSCIEYLWIFFNDTLWGYPKGYNIFPPNYLKHSQDKKYLRLAFKGYIYTLQYTWFKVIGEKWYAKTSLNKLDSIIKLQAEQLEEHKAVPEWRELDRFFEIIREEVIRKQKPMPMMMNPESDLLLLDKYNKNLLKDLLNPKNIENPAYLNLSDKTSLYKQLDYTLLWTDVHIVDTFSELDKFVLILAGMVKRRHEDTENKIEMRIFKHPEANGNSYSFGILAEAYYKPGWVIVLDCGTDYSGHGGGVLDEATKLINENYEKGYVNKSELVVDLKIFREYLMEKFANSLLWEMATDTQFDGINVLLKRSQVRNKIKDFTSDLKGKFFEYLYFKWLVESRNYQSVNCDIWYNGEQIDNLGKIGDDIHIFECKLSMHSESVKMIVKQIRQKLNALKGYENSKDVIPYVVFYKKISTGCKNAFENNKINVVDNFESTLRTAEIFDNIRNSISNILESEFDYK